ncbi:hypothetical protein B0T21DRAFT_366070 [Apiosordaria backusii]|uniref:Uncharacterized protein n=1 Tax=Apiosordaria backusii TaxID=314023 RepID=A0AA40BKM4_9PEZI|nr:hypothetical protein B0T21DRAFT_366070 [Apiosordaria backusii]
MENEQTVDLEWLADLLKGKYYITPLSLVIDFYRMFNNDDIRAVLYNVWVILINQNP